PEAARFRTASHTIATIVPTSITRTVSASSAMRRRKMRPRLPATRHGSHGSFSGHHGGRPGPQAAARLPPSPLRGFGGTGPLSPLRGFGGTGPLSPLRGFGGTGPLSPL